MTFDEIEKLRKEFKHYNTMLQNQVTKGLATSSGGGEVRLEFLDDVDSCLLYTSPSPRD